MLKKILKISLLNLLFFTLVLGAVDFFFYYKAKRERLLPWPPPDYVPEKYTGLWKKSFIERDEALGKKMRPNVKSEVSRADKDENVLFHAKYSIDQRSRRFTPNDNGTANRFGLFFGCSFTFGEGVSDNETLPYFFSEASSSVHAYNYGVSGYGPNNVLALLENKNIKSEITENGGFAIYTFINDHVFRAIGSRSKSTGWWSYNPYYILDSEGKPVRNGNFTENRFFWSSIYRWLSFSNLVNYYNFEFPLKISDGDIEYTAALLKEIQKKYIEQFGNDRFYLLFYPGANFSGRVKAALKDSPIKILDYSEYQFKTPNAVSISGDTHPTSAAYGELAHEILKQPL